VTLLDGRSFELEDSNDVDWDNKGILIAPTGSTGSRVAGLWELPLSTRLFARSIAASFRRGRRSS